SVPAPLLEGSMKELFNVLAPAVALERLLERLEPCPRPERVPTWEALERVLAESVVAPETLPAFPRATVDGFAVRAGDTFGASEGLPAYLEVVGEVLMGQAPTLRLEVGQCARIAPGGMPPPGAAAVG